MSVQCNYLFEAKKQRSHDFGAPGVSGSRAWTDVARGVVRPLDKFSEIEETQ